jgi:hypothetical protein
MYLLIGNGFKHPGKRLPTSLAFYTGVKLQIKRPQGWRDSTKRLGDVIVYARWTQEPTPQQLQEAKQQVPRCVW